VSLRAALKVSLEQLRRRRLAPVTVAVVDSGIDATHPALRGRIVRAMCIAEARGKCRVRKVAVPRNHDVYGHGTAVSSIIAKIAPNARFIDVRVLDDRNACSGETLIAGFRQAIEEGARIINMSLACHARFAPELAALCETAYRRNQLIVASKRNMPLVDNGFPAELSSCIGVDVGRFSTPLHIMFRDNHVIQFVAHGEAVVVPAAGGGTTTVTGTSFATPAVSGLCALLVGANPDLQPFDLKSLLRAFAD
jgi:subtilisin family serine protease